MWDQKSQGAESDQGDRKDPPTKQVELQRALLQGEGKPDLYPGASQGKRWEEKEREREIPCHCVVLHTSVTEPGHSWPLTNRM